MEERILVIIPTDIQKAQKMAQKMAEAVGFDAGGAGEIAIAVSELASNLVKHKAVRGEIMVRALEEPGKSGVEIISLDEGPGIADIEQAMEHSTVGTLGIGLSSVKRLTDEFIIRSTTGGTVVSARKWLKRAAPPQMAFSVQARPHRSEDVSGDAYFIKYLPFGVVFGVIDVLGHGRDAWVVAQKALRIIDEEHRKPIDRLVEECHVGLVGTRGAALAFCRIDYEKNILHHVGIGNVETRVYGVADPPHPFCFNGTVGLQMENYQVHSYPYRKGMIIVVFSDGISGRFELPQEMETQSPEAISGWIFNGFARDYDDATVLVGK